MWTHFWDMHSGGGTKEDPYESIYIEAGEDEAKRIFYNRFGHNPERVSCTCCGEDYSISESETLEEASAYHRGEGRFSRKTKCSLKEYCKREDVLVVRVNEIEAGERYGSVPEQGYVWVD